MTQEKNNECLPDDVWPVGKKAALFTSVVAFGLGLFDFIDRQVMAAILPFLKEEWDISDTQVGMLISIVNMAIPLMLIPSAYFIDRWSRKKMLGIMGMVWSLATGACALAGNYTHLLVCRFFIGAGESGYNPAAVPLLAASFPKKWRGTAVSITQIGTTLGVPLGTVLGAYIASHWGWRHAFGVVMVPGLILAVLAFYLKDFKTAPTDRIHTVSYLSTISGIIRIPSLVFTIFGAVMFYLFQGTNMNWLPSYLVREGGLAVTQASLYFAVVTTAGLVSTAMAGPLIDFVRRRFHNAVPLVLSCGLILSTVMFAAGYGLLVPGSPAQVAALTAGNLLGCVTVSGIYINVVSLTHPGVQATALSVVIFCQNILGFALGPLLAGMLSDHFSLQIAMQVLALAPGFAGLAFAVCCFTYKRDLERVSCQDVMF